MFTLFIIIIILLDCPDNLALMFKCQFFVNAGSKFPNFINLTSHNVYVTLYPLPHGFKLFFHNLFSKFLLYILGMFVLGQMPSTNCSTKVS